MNKTESTPLTTHTFEVNGTTRSYLSNDEVPTPKYIVIVFHGNGGTAEGFAKKYVLQNIFSEGLIVYLQGIPGIGGGFDPKGLKNGWQRKKGDGDDRDLYAIDMLVKHLKSTYPKLKDKIYAMGHSNGGRFTYLLWSERAGLFNGFIINAHQGVDLLGAELEPRSAMIITGRQDRVVNNANQLKSADLVQSLLQCDSHEIINDELTIYRNIKTGLRLHHYIHLGGHDLPKPALKFIAAFLEGSR